MLKSCNHVSLYTPVSKQVTENRHRMTLCCRLFTNTVTIGFACCVQEKKLSLSMLFVNSSDANCRYDNSEEKYGS